MACVLAITGESGAGVVSPRSRGALPPQLRELKKRSKDAFTLEHAWLERRANQVRGDSRYGPVRSSAAGVLKNPSRAVSGTLSIPVVLGLYGDISVPPFTKNAFDVELFTGPWATGTMRQYWNEVSYGLFNVTGTVFDWVQLAENENYYTGGSSQGYLPPPYGTARTGEMIKEIVDALDPATDFGAFDNDGADGVPNSGDDDGYVDVMLVIHPTFGAECDGISPHMWSHSWRYSRWPIAAGQPYATNDPAAGGGAVMIDDYIIVPSLSCTTGIIEIGVICHELGHAIGLPDLYDWDGGSSGIGFWGLMGAGNWNTPASPAHLCAWSREYLGWLDPVEMPRGARAIDLEPVASSGDAVKLPLPTRRFKRAAYASGSNALICSYGEAEAGNRGWPGGGGYGNGWDESLFHEFSVDGSRPVTMRYDMTIDSEPDYDFGRLLLEKGGAVETLAVYTGRFSRAETIDIGARLPAGPSTFTLRFEFTSDESYSDEDGDYESSPTRAFRVDNVRIDGGGLAYFSDFELDAGAWRNGSPPAEYFLIENRRRGGFDASLPGQGMIVWHAESSILNSLLGNSGGTSNSQTRGLVLEEADGSYHLLTPSYLGGNTGDGGDPYPGTANNREFGPGTNPSSETNSGVETPARISGITYGPFNVSALFSGGIPAPFVETVLPDTIDKEHAAEAMLDIRGSWMDYGARAFLSLGLDTVWADSVDWRGEERIIAVFPKSRLYAGDWNLVVVSSDGAPSEAPKTVVIVSVYLSASITAGENYLLAEWVLKDTPGVRGCLLYRFVDGATSGQLVTPDTLRSGTGAFSYRDYAVQEGRLYAYMIVTYLNGGREEPYLLSGPFCIGCSPFIAHPNYPNPFSRETTVSLFLPEPAAVAIDVYDVSGRRVARLDEGLFPRGAKILRWNPAERGLAAGIYFCVIRSGGEKKLIKMIYVP